MDNDNDKDGVVDRLRHLERAATKGGRVIRSEDLFTIGDAIQTILGLQEMIENTPDIAHTPTTPTYDGNEKGFVAVGIPDDTFLRTLEGATERAKALITSKGAYRVFVTKVIGETEITYNVKFK